MSSALGLLEAVGLEIELMIVDAASLDVRACADRPLFEASGTRSGDHENGRISWSNELVRHLIELKSTHPERDPAGLAQAFQDNVGELTRRLAPHGARLMPSGMHPWMDPRIETELWPFEYSEVYRAYDRVFDCRRHGWANLQSVHLNLSFAGDQDFARLHAAVRLALPLVPALAASSPLREGRLTGFLDQRLEEYRINSARVPAMAGAIVPEPVFDPATYRSTILDPLQVAVRALDPEQVLEGEWLNARGAIARFDRGAIELRLIDTQECPRADVAVAWAMRCVISELCHERWASLEQQKAFATPPLAALLAEAARVGPEARLTDPALARALGWHAPRMPTLGELWREVLVPRVVADAATPRELVEPLEHILEHGTLAQRLVRSVGPAPTRARLHATYGELCACLQEGRLFRSP